MRAACTKEYYCFTLCQTVTVGCINTPGCVFYNLVGMDFWPMNQWAGCRMGTVCFLKDCMISARSVYCHFFNQKRKILRGRLTYFDKVTHNYPLVLYLSKLLCIGMQGPCNSSLISHLGVGNKASGISPRSSTDRMRLAISVLLEHLDS